ncbi:MAG: cation-translocating P-type ATPase [Clostridia bacterium]|nr:cation-translocating P-type ATPase [Clostridia bacterium]
MDKYSVDEILLEYEMQQQEQSKRAKPPKSAVETFVPEAQKTEERTTEIPAVRPKAETTREIPAVKKPTADDEGVRVASAPKTPPVTQHTVSINTRTRVLTVAQSEEKYQTQEVPLRQLENGQLTLDQYQEPPVDEAQLEQEVRLRRRAKIDGFRLIEGGKTPLKLTGDEEESDDDEELLLPEEEETDEMLEDFGSYDEAEAIRNDFAYRRRTGGMAVVASTVIEALLFLLTAAYHIGWLASVSASLLTALHTVLLTAIVVMNHRLIRDGLKVLFTVKANADTPAALCGLVGMLYTGAQFFNLTAVADGQAMFLSAAAGMGVLAGVFGRQAQLIRISRNFAYVGSEKAKKMAADFIDDEKLLNDIGHPAADDGIVSVMYYRQAPFLTKFLEHSYAGDPADRAMRWFVPLSMGVSVICAAAYALMNRANAWYAPSVFASVLMLTLPVFSMFTVQRTLARSGKKALRSGAMIGGWHTVEKYGRHIGSVVVEAQELFPKDSVKLHGIKTFSGTRIDEAITDAAAVMMAAGGPLAPIFRRLIENRTDILRAVDSLAYEQDMGLSGWVGGRRVLIGNRRLLANHGVEVPSKEHEERFVADGRNIVYLSTGGELSAMFVVSYPVSDAAKAHIKALYREHIRLTVRTCDPNITAALILEATGLPEQAVEVLSASKGRAYGAMLTSKAGETAPALLACNGRMAAKLFAPVQCARLYRGVRAGLWSQMIPCIFFMAVSVFVTSVSGVLLRGDLLAGAMLGVGLIGWLITKLFRT